MLKRMSQAKSAQRVHVITAFEASTHSGPKGLTIEKVERCGGWYVGDVEVVEGARARARRRRTRTPRTGPAERRGRERRLTRRGGANFFDTPFYIGSCHVLVKFQLDVAPRILGRFQ